jgi:hypothetical protein
MPGRTPAEPGQPEMPLRAFGPPQVRYSRQLAAAIFDRIAAIAECPERSQARNRRQSILKALIALPARPCFASWLGSRHSARRDGIPLLLRLDRGGEYRVQQRSQRLCIYLRGSACRRPPGHNPRSRLAPHGAPRDLDNKFAPWFRPGTASHPRPQPRDEVARSVLGNENRCRIGSQARARGDERQDRLDPAATERRRPSFLEPCACQILSELPWNPDRDCTMHAHDSNA